MSASGVFVDVPHRCARRHFYSICDPRPNTIRSDSALNFVTLSGEVYIGDSSGGKDEELPSAVPEAIRQLMRPLLFSAYVAGVLRRRREVGASVCVPGPPRRDRRSSGSCSLQSSSQLNRSNVTVIPGYSDFGRYLRDVPR